MDSTGSVRACPVAPADGTGVANFKSIYGGQINVESKVGGGATFVMILLLVS